MSMTRRVVWFVIERLAFFQDLRVSVRMERCRDGGGDEGKGEEEDRGGWTHRGTWSMDWCRVVQRADTEKEGKKGR